MNTMHITQKGIYTKLILANEITPKKVEFANLCLG